MTRVVIPWRHDDHRAPLLEFVLEWWQTRHPSWAVALADTPGEWSKAAAINRAAAEIDGIVVVADADVWCDGIGDAVEAVEAGARWAVPHRMVHRLNRRATRMVLDGAQPGRFYFGDGLAERPYVGVLGGGMLVVPASALREVPFDERFVGWGQEDESWGAAASLLLGRPWRGVSPLWHLWHEPPGRMNRRWGSPAARNLGRRYRAARTDTGAMGMLVDEARAIAAARQNEQRVVAVPPVNDESRG